MLSLPSRAQQFSIRYIWAKEVGIGPRWAIIWLFLLGSVFALVYGAIKLIPLVELGTKVQEAIKARAQKRKRNKLERSWFPRFASSSARLRAHRSSEDESADRHGAPASSSLEASPLAPPLSSTQSESAMSSTTSGSSAASNSSLKTTKQAAVSPMKSAPRSNQAHASGAPDGGARNDEQFPCCEVLLPPCVSCGIPLAAMSPLGQRIVVVTLHMCAATLMIVISTTFYNAVFIGGMHTLWWLVITPYALGYMSAFSGAQTYAYESLNRQIGRVTRKVSPDQTAASTTAGTSTIGASNGSSMESESASRESSFPSKESSFTEVTKKVNPPLPISATGPDSECKEDIDES